jgi:hypothetical protein
MRVEWLKSGSEPSLDEILMDPITQAVMRSDGVDADQVRLVALAARRRLFDSTSTVGFWKLLI